MSLYRLDASIRVEGSHSRAIAVFAGRTPEESRTDEQQAGRFHGRELGAVVAITPPKAA